MARTPTDPTKAQVWVTKGLDELDFEFYFPQGPKGDPGGIVTGSLLGTANLNEILTSGVYRQPSWQEATLARNYPKDLVGGILLVSQIYGPEYITQEFTPLFPGSIGPRVVFRRQRDNLTWSTWKAFNSSRVDQTAGRAIYQWDDLNGREQLIYGDTGVRNIKTTMINGWSAVILHIQRKGGQVTLSHYVISPTGATSGQALVIPTGFRPSGVEGNIMWMTYLQSGVMQPLVYNEAAGSLYPPTTGPTYNGEIQQATWPTNDPWPTTLPGTAYGTIPNL